MTVHYLKSQPQFYQEIIAGRKTHDLRKNDREFNIGDYIVLREWSELDGYTGGVATVEITYITDVDSPCAYSPAALHPAFCILSIKLI